MLRDPQMQRARAHLERERVSEGSLIACGHGGRGGRPGARRSELIKAKRRPGEVAVDGQEYTLGSRQLSALEECQEQAGRLCLFRKPLVFGNDIRLQQFFPGSIFLPELFSLLRDIKHPCLELGNVDQAVDCCYLFR